MITKNMLWFIFDLFGVYIYTINTVVKYKILNNFL